MFEENIIETEVSSNIVETESDSLIGTPGIDGVTFTPSVSQEGIISWTNNGGLSNPTPINIKGDKGDKGEPGEKGEKGDKGDKGPKGEKGDTYTLTEQDKQDISNMTVESSESTFNQYYNGKLEDFNSNATSKTNDYNTNATNKTTEYNNNAISKVNEFNTNADNKIAEYDEHSQELNNKIVSTRNELERVKNDVLETGTDTDTFVHLEDSAMAEYQELSVDGVCEQETTTGKNLFDESIMPTNTMNGIKWEYTNKKIKISGTATNTYSHNENIPITLQAGTYYFVKSEATNLIFNARFYNIDGELIANSGRYNPFTISENATRIELLVKGMTSGTSYNQEINFMVSTTNGNYEPYTGGQPSPSPDYPQEIKTIENSLKITSCNKNLFDTTKIASGTSQGISYSVDNNGIIILNGTTNGNSIEIPLNTNISLNGTYTYIPKISDITKINNIALKDTSFNNVFLSQLPTTSNINGIVTKIILYVSSGIVFNNDTLSIQILKRTQSTETDFEQHLETIIEANLPEGEFIGKINDTYKDTLKVEYNEENGQYHLNLYKRVYKNNSYNGESYNYYISTTSRKDGNIECGELQTGQVVYYVGDETIIDLGIVDMPITYNETTNLFTDSDLMPQINAKYHRTFEKTIQNLQVNEKALKQELIDINTRLSALETAQTSVVNESEVTE